MTLQAISPDRLKTLMDAGQAVLIDIREPSEHAREHILGARLAPLSAFDRHDFDRDKDKVAVFHCKSGNRTAMNVTRLAAAGFREAYILQGGLDAWRKAGLPLHENRDAPIDLMRQVQITAGSMVALGALLAWLVSPWFIALSGFVGAGLVFAGVTGFCGMARLLALMPWNRRFATPA
ncbi:rhodanese-like domain-containing protein [Ferrovibrio sp.]|uniref:rhodanese-like domain-containing protein n=1 Tax=Ferrovibrio sp. TaxID=1917215 RepID=UPI003D127E64